MTSTRINILNDEVVGKISAGEVVERPASVVKELVENSIDAGADNIEITVQSAGQSLIRVADNGEGMTMEDAKLACQRHATSKIKDIEDLDSLTTLGFRGEALSSIAAVSQMELVSSRQADKTGIYVYLESGEILKTRPAGRSTGTSIEVRNLFYNVPARRKFLRKESTELAEIVNVVGRFVLAYPGIEFKLTQGDKVILHASKNMDPLERVRLIFGEDISGDMVKITGCKGGHEVSGYVSRPSNTRKDKRTQLFFVNRRFVRSRLLSASIYDAYTSLLERGRHPAVVLFLSIPPGEIDVNVHPTKLQIKFSNEKVVKNTIANIIKDAFFQIGQDRHQRPRGVPSEVEGTTDPSDRRESRAKSRGPQTPATAGSPERSRGDYRLQTGGQGPPVFAGEPATQGEFAYDYSDKIRKDLKLRGYESFSEDEVSIPVLGSIFQIGGCYIIQIKTDSIVITDQHAAHERVLYEFFTKASGKAPVEAQNLLFPVRIDLSAEETVLIEKAADSFEALGFHIKPFGDKSFIVQAIPPVLKDRDIKTIIHDVLTDLVSYDLNKITLIEELIKLTSCHAAIKAGDVLSKEEILSLLDQLSRCSLPFTCPHGRPTTLKININELEKRFRRT